MINILNIRNYLTLLISLIIIFVSCNNSNNKNIRITSSSDSTKHEKIRIIYNTGIDTLIEYYKNGNVKLKRIKDSLQRKMIIYDYYKDGAIKKYSICYKTDSNKYVIFFKREYLKNGKINDFGNIIGAYGHFYDTNPNTRELLMARPPNCMYYLGVSKQGDTSYTQLKLVNNVAMHKIQDTTRHLELMYLFSLKDTIRDTIVFDEMKAIVNISN